MNKNLMYMILAAEAMAAGDRMNRKPVKIEYPEPYVPTEEEKAAARERRRKRKLRRENALKTRAGKRSPKKHRYTRK